MMDNTIERRTNNLTQVETMFDARRTPWDGLGKRIAGAVTSRDAIRLAGLDWNVVPTDIISEATGLKIPGVKGNMMSLNDSLADVESAVEQYRGLYYKLFAYMKRVIEANNFDFNKRMKELYPKKSV